MTDTSLVRLAKAWAVIAWATPVNPEFPKAFGVDLITDADGNFCLYAVEQTPVFQHLKGILTEEQYSLFGDALYGAFELLIEDYA